MLCSLRLMIPQEKRGLLVFKRCRVQAAMRAVKFWMQLCVFVFMCLRTMLTGDVQERPWFDGFFLVGTYWEKRRRKEQGCGKDAAGARSGHCKHFTFVGHKCPEIIRCSSFALVGT